MTLTFDLINELYITLLEDDFHCTKFFPEYEQAFEKISQSEPITENGITFRFTVWKRK
ncbi:MAG TPA: dihydrofolate reductase [Candidatus Saccharimonadales bacterium]|nr:dihydrofolate reductase [Candidatus Saccharimonadales bacterium]